MRNWTMMLTPMLLVACAVPAAEVAQPEEEYPEFGATPGKQCRNADFTRFIGRQATSALATEARDAAKAAIVRWLQPGQIVTMEYRADRLNITLDSRNVVTAIRCG